MGTRQRWQRNRTVAQLEGWRININGNFQLAIYVVQFSGAKFRKFPAVAIRLLPTPLWLNVSRLERTSGICKAEP